MNKPIRILLAEDSEDDALLLEDVIKKGGYAPEMRRVEDPEAMAAALEDGGWDMILSDYAMPSFNGLDALNLVKNRGHDLPFIIVSGVVGEETAVGLMKAGAHDYVFKDNLARLVPVIERELQEAEVRRLRRKAEEALRESEEKFRQLVSTTTDAIMLFDAETRLFLEVNKACEDLYGYSRQEFLKMKQGDISAEPEKSNDSIKRVLEGALDRIDSRLHKKKDGTIFPVEISTSAFQAGDRRVLCGVVRDITERKRAEEALREAQQELALRNKIAEVFLTCPDEQIYDKVLQVILEAFDSRHGNLGYINEEGALVWRSTTGGFSKCQDPDKHVVVPREEWYGIWGRALKEKKTHWSNEAFHVPEGHIPVRNAMDVPIIHHGELIGNVLIGNKSTDYDEKDQRLLEAVTAYIAPILRARLERDRTEAERKRAEEALRESEFDLTRAQQMAHLGNYHLNLLNGEVNWSDETFRIVGMDPSQRPPTYEQYLRMVHPDDLTLVQTTVNQSIEKAEPFDFEYQIVDTEGNTKYLHSIGKLQLSQSGVVEAVFGTIMDITERKRAEEALRDSEERLELALESAGLGLWDQDFKTGEIIRSSRWAEMLGYTLDEVPSDIQAWKKLVHPDDLPALEQTGRDHLAGLTPFFSFEHRLRAKTGEWKWIRNWGRVTERDSTGAPVRATGVHMDITVRKRVEEALTESEYKYRDLVERAGIAILIDDVQGNFKYFNDTLTTLFGYSREELTKLTMFTLVHPDDRKMGLESHKSRLLNNSFLAQYEFRGVKKDGSEIFVSVDATALKEGEEIVGWRSYITDITERKRAEEALRESEEKYRTMFESMAQGVFYQHADGTLVDANSAALEMFGLDRDQFLGKTSVHPSWKVIHEDGSDFPGEEHPSMIALRTGSPVAGVVAGVFNPLKKDYVWLNINAIPQFKLGEDRPFQVFVTLHDITERKRAEEALRKTTEELRAEREELSEKNLVLKYILEHIEEERQDYKQKVCQDIEQAVIPVVKQLQEGIEAAHAGDFEGLEANLKAILAKDVDVFRERYAKLTPRELEVCDIIKERLSSKEISESLNLSLLTVHKHREDIRKKLGITNKNVNLGTYLRVR